MMAFPEETRMLLLMDIVPLQKTLLNLSSDDLEQEHLHPRRGSITGLDILIVVARHAAEHLGQPESSKRTSTGMRRSSLSTKKR
jgi:hypothetical protein